MVAELWLFFYRYMHLERVITLIDWQEVPLKAILSAMQCIGYTAVNNHTCMQEHLYLVVFKAIVAAGKAISIANR